MTYLERADELLAKIRARSRYRSVELRQPEADLIDFSSNDYLALSRDRQVVAALRQATRAGSGGARLLGGRHREHSLLEEELAIWLGRERALLFSSGYLAALGAVTTLALCTNGVYSDELNHASLIDGIRLSRAPKTIYPHLALPSKQHRVRGAAIVTESIFSMDGDAIDVENTLRDLHPEDVLLIDEAHALGVTGPNGAGLGRETLDPRVIVMGTLSKSFGGLGGFIAGPAPFIELLVNTARSFIFDTALPPALALSARVALSVIQNDVERRGRLHENVRHLRLGLRHIGFQTNDAPSSIVPVVLGTEVMALQAAASLRSRRIYAPAVRPPTVPAGSSRLRLCVRSDHTLEQIDLLIDGLQACTATS